MHLFFCPITMKTTVIIVCVSSLLAYPALDVLQPGSALKGVDKLLGILTIILNARPFA